MIPQPDAPSGGIDDESIGTPTPTSVDSTAPGPAETKAGNTESTAESGPLTPATNTSEFERPTPPKSPESKPQSRIHSVRFSHREPSPNGSGYADFDLFVRANTTMRNVDPEPDVDGEPYFYVTVEGNGVSRASVPYRDNGTFGLEVPVRALTPHSAGTLSVSVGLYDVDHAHDDHYDSWNGTIEYTPANGPVSTGLS
ncbi:hypothetical protein [Halocatena halophila]|uniref:hypothetical protein n=1 Tax=Halocatena halophila TaxID=2814576 RepID=UPI002ECFE9D2